MPDSIDDHAKFMKENWDTITLAASVSVAWWTSVMSGVNGMLCGLVLLATAIFACARAGVWVLKLRAAWRNRNRYSFFKKSKDEEETDL